MNGFVLNLFFGCAHKVANSSLCILSPVSFNIGEFHAHKFLVEAIEEGEKEVFLTLQPEIAVTEIECPGPGRTLGKHEEVFSRSDETKNCQPSQEDQCLSSCKTKVLIMRADLFGTA